MAIVDNGEGVIVDVDDTPVITYDYRFTEVGRVVIFRDVMATPWRPMKGVKVRELGSNSFLFIFYCEQDISRVLSDGPWMFDKIWCYSVGWCKGRIR